MKKTLLPLALIAMIAFSCKKDKDAPALTKENLAGSYTISSVVIKASGQQQDITSDMISDCQKDDIYTLTADGHYSVADGAIKCDGGSEDSGTFTLDGTTIDFADYQGTASYDGKNLVVTNTQNFGGINGEFKWTFVKK